jgi:hypothetical protein
MEYVNLYHYPLPSIPFPPMSNSGGFPKCQLEFGRDMIYNIAFGANWDRIQKRKQDIINKSNQKETTTIAKFLMNISLETKCYQKHPGFSGNCQHLV